MWPSIGTHLLFALRLTFRVHEFPLKSIRPVAMFFTDQNLMMS